MAWTTEILVGGLVVLGAAALAANSSSANADNRVRKDRQAVESAASRWSYRATCIDLISSPFANTVRTRPGC